MDKRVLFRFFWDDSQNLPTRDLHPLGGAA